MHPRMIKQKISMQKNALQARLIKQNVLQARFFD